MTATLAVQTDQMLKVGKFKRLIFCGSGSKSSLMIEVGSTSELGGESVEKELEAEAIISKSGVPDFQTGYNRWGKM